MKQNEFKEWHYYTYNDCYGEKRLMHIHQRSYSTEGSMHLCYSEFIDGIWKNMNYTTRFMAPEEDIWQGLKFTLIKNPPKICTSCDEPSYRLIVVEEDGKRFTKLMNPNNLLASIEKTW